jgi:hypothetical protein
MDGSRAAVYPDEHEQDFDHDSHELSLITRARLSRARAFLACGSCRPQLDRW